MTREKWKIQGLKKALQDVPAEVWLWDAVKGTPLVSVLLGVAGAAQLTYSPDGSTLAVVAGADRVVRLLDPRSGQERSRFEAHARSVRCLAFSPDGKVLATGSGNRTDSSSTRA